MVVGNKKYMYERKKKYIFILLGEEGRKADYAGKD